MKLINFQCDMCGYHFESAIHKTYFQHIKIAHQSDGFFPTSCNFDGCQTVMFAYSWFWRHWYVHKNINSDELSDTPENPSTLVLTTPEGADFLRYWMFYCQMLNWAPCIIKFREFHGKCKCIYKNACNTAKHQTVLVMHLNQLLKIMIWCIWWYLEMQSSSTRSCLHTSQGSNTRLPNIFWQRGVWQCSREC